MWRSERRLCKVRKLWRVLWELTWIPPLLVCIILYRCQKHRWSNAAWISSQRVGTHGSVAAPVLLRFLFGELPSFHFLKKKKEEEDDSTMCRVFSFVTQYLPCLMTFRVVFGILENVEWAAWFLNVGSDVLLWSVAVTHAVPGSWRDMSRLQGREDKLCPKAVWYWADADRKAAETKCKVKVKAEDAFCAFIFRYDLLCPP